MGVQKSQNSGSDHYCWDRESASRRAIEEPALKVVESCARPEYILEASTPTPTMILVSQSEICVRLVPDCHPPPVVCGGGDNWVAGAVAP